MRLFTKLYNLIRDFIVTTTLAAYPTRPALPDVTNNTGVDEFWDFLNGTIGTSFNNQISGTGLVAFYLTQSPDFYPGAVQCITDALNDTAGFETPGCIALSSVTSSLTFQTRGKVLSLSTGSHAYSLKFGFSNVFDFVTPPTFEAQFIYNTALSSNWICNTTSSVLSVTDVFNTTVPVTTTDTYFKIYITPTLIYYYINNVLVHTYAMDFTAITGDIRIGTRQLKTLGSGTEKITVFDAIKFQQNFVTPRSFT